MTHQEKAIRRTSKNKLGVISLVIPRKFARDLGLAQPADIVVEKLADGILIRKLEVS